MNFKVPVYFSTVILVMWAFFKCSLGQSRHSPCPGVFTYEDGDSIDDRWYGEITLKVDTTIQGATFRITLDRPSQLLVSWAGTIISNDNKVYIANHDNAVLDGGVTYKVRIMVKFDPASPVPLLDSIHFNSRRICPPDLPLTLGHGDLVVPTRPDLDVSEPTDVTSDIGRRPTVSSGTVLSGNVNVSTNACGQVNVASPLITSGQQTQRGQWPWHVALYKSEGVNLNYICGGSLVSKNKVITAAHCLIMTPGNRIINHKNLVVYLGKYNLRAYTGEQGVQTKEVLRLNVNPNYNATNFHGDIAVLTLASDAQFTNYVRPVCIWEQTTNTHDIEGKEGVVAGWGLDENDQTSEELKVAKLPVVSTETCLRSYPKFYSEYTSDKSFCAGFRNGNSSTSPCNGDSGGGLVFKRDSTWYLRGIVSLSVAKEGLNFCNPNYYVIFTDVAKYHEFLRVNLQQ